MNGSGMIDRPEVFQLLRMIMGRTFSDVGLQEMVDRIMDEHPQGLTFEGFSSLLDLSDLSKLTLTV